MENGELRAKAKAQRILRAVGDAAISGFRGARPDAILLKAKFDSVACWDDGGFFHYVVVTNFSGPSASYSGLNAEGVEAPLLFQIRVNTHPPVELYHYLKRHKPAVPDYEDRIATEPYLEIHARPKQIARLGAWLATWYEYQRREEILPPKPPVKLVYNAVNEGADQPEW